MKKFYGKEEKIIEKLEPKIEISPELRKKQSKKAKQKKPWKVIIKNNYLQNITFR